VGKVDLDTPVGMMMEGEDFKYPNTQIRKRILQGGLNRQDAKGAKVLAF